MILIICVDDAGGMMFHHRRQSADRLLRRRMIRLAEGSRLWMNAYSASQFDENDRSLLQIDENPAEKAGREEYCFIENGDHLDCAGRIERIILYKWNRRYPSDVYFTLDLSDYILLETAEFTGSSHDRITEEVYVKKA